MIQFLSPLLIAVRGVRRWPQLLWPALALGGVALLAGRLDGPQQRVGLLIAACGALCWAFYIWVLESAGNHGGAKQIGVSMTLIALMLAPFTAADALAAHLTAAQLGMVVMIALACTGLPFVLELVSMRRMSSAVFAIMMSLEPAVAALVGFVLLGETLSLTAIAALLMVVCASIGAHRSFSAHPPDDFH